MRPTHYQNGDGQRRKIPKYLGKVLPSITDPHEGGVWKPTINTKDRLEWRNEKLELKIVFERIPHRAGYPYPNRIVQNHWRAFFESSPREGRPETRFPFNFAIGRGRKTEVTEEMFYFIMNGERFHYKFKEWKGWEKWEDSK